MTDAAAVHTAIADSAAAGSALATQIRQRMSGAVPDAVVVFASPRHNYGVLLRALLEGCPTPNLVGCSSAGEFASGVQAEGTACAVALRSPEMYFKASIGRGLRTDRARAAGDLAASFAGTGRHDYRYRTALVLTDALAGHTDEFVEELAILTAGTYRFAGGGAGDDAKFESTHVFFGAEAVADAAVALEILSNKPIGIGVRHGWRPATPPMRVTAADGMTLGSLNAVPAALVFEEHAEATAQRFDVDQPLPFFLQNVLGVDAGDGYKLRVPLAVQPGGAVACAADVPAGATAHIMTTSAGNAAEAAASATEDALSQLGAHEPAVAIFFDCVATRLRTGLDFGNELQEVQRRLGSAAYAGCNTYGQISRAEGQFSGFHNCTAVVCVFPK